MRAIDVRLTGCAVLGVILLVSSVPVSPSPASAAGYSRRIAIAPFASLTKEDIGGTVSVLPRLLASRLMALAGADVVLLPAGASPVEKAREAKVPLLLQGTVSKLGKGYSIDATVTDLETGRPAGAFFAVAATEDDIIAQLGLLSGEIAAKLFGVQGAIRAVSPAPAPTATAPAQPVVPQVIGGVTAALSPRRLLRRRRRPLRSRHAGRRSSRLSPIIEGESDKIIDELYGVVTLETDGQGSTLVAAYGKTTLHLYRVKGTEVFPFTRIAKPLDHHILSVSAPGHRRGRLEGDPRHRSRQRDGDVVRPEEERGHVPGSGGGDPLLPGGAPGLDGRSRCWSGSTRGSTPRSRGRS